MLDRHEQIYGYYPLKVALDGRFASKDNLKAAGSRKNKEFVLPKSGALKKRICVEPTECTESFVDSVRALNQESPGSNSSKREPIYYVQRDLRYQSQVLHIINDGNVKTDLYCILTRRNPTLEILSFGDAAPRQAERQ